MKPRLNMKQAAPDAYQAMLALSTYAKRTGLEPSLLDLVDIRASQINGCAFCLNMHLHEARARGETEERLFLLDAWRETPLYTDRERAALAWTEALTRLGHEGVPDWVYEEARRHFSEEEIVKLSMKIVVINSWNRLMIGFRTLPEVKKERPA